MYQFLDDFTQDELNIIVDILEKEKDLYLQKMISIDDFVDEIRIYLKNRKYQFF